MSESRKLMLLICAEAAAATLMRVVCLLIVASVAVSVACAFEAPDPAKVIDHANSAGAMSASAVWALFAATLILGQVALGFFIFKAQTAVDEKLASIASDISAIKASRPVCAGSEAINTVLNAARTELERAGALIRNGR